MSKERKQQKGGRLFGALAVDKGLLTDTQLTEALTAQEEYLKEHKVHKKIGAILIEKGYMTQRDVQTVLKEQDPQAGIIAWFAGLFTLSR